MGRVKIRLADKVVVANILTTFWLVVEPVLKIKLAAEPTPLEPNWMLPTTWRAEAGVAVPMPKLPAK